MTTPNRKEESRRRFPKEMLLMNGCPNCGQEVNRKLVESIVDDIEAEARESERERIAQTLSKAGDNKISILNDDNFTGTYWVSLNNVYHLLTGRQINDDWENGTLEKNATIEMIIRQALTPPTK